VGRSRRSTAAWPATTSCSFERTSPKPRVVGQFRLPPLGGLGAGRELFRSPSVTMLDRTRKSRSVGGMFSDAELIKHVRDGSFERAFKFVRSRRGIPLWIVWVASLSYIGYALFRSVPPTTPGQPGAPGSWEPVIRMALAVGTAVGLPLLVALLFSIGGWKRTALEFNGRIREFFRSPDVRRAQRTRAHVEAVGSRTVRACDVLIAILGEHPSGCASMHFYGLVAELVGESNIDSVPLKEAANKLCATLCQAGAMTRETTTKTISPRFQGVSFRQEMFTPLADAIGLVEIVRLLDEDEQRSSVDAAGPGRAREDSDA
jgi:hypothetical protein